MATQPAATTKPATVRLHEAQQKGVMRIQDFLYLCLSHWQWFVIGLAVSFLLAFLYIKTSTPQYSKSATIIINTDSDGNSSADKTGMLAGLGISSGNSSVNDECAIIKSPDLMRDVVRRLSLYMSYTTKGRFRDIDLYGGTLPVQVLMPDLKEDQTASFKLHLGSNGEYLISDMKLNGRSLEDREVKGRIGIPVRTPLGNVTVNPSEAYNASEDMDIRVAHNSVKSVAKSLAGRIKVTQDADSYNIVTLDITDSNPNRAEDILSTVIACYNDRWMKDKRELADHSSQFIDERIALLQQELGSVDSDISSFKSTNMVPDVDAAASLYMSQATQSSTALRDLRNQEYMVKYIRNYLRNTDNNTKLLPTNSGLSSPSLNTQISQYNTKIMERNSLVSQSSTSNPLVTEMDQQLTAMRGALIASVDNEAIAISEQIRSQEGLTGEANSKIASNPRQAKYLLSVERQQKVKETLYLYLLQKREENQLNQAFSSYNTRIVNEADGSNAPVSPIPSKIYLLAFAAGLLIPALALFVRETSVHVVRGRRDIKDMKTPFSGEIPLYGPKQKITRTIKRNMDPEAITAVKENSRNAINEAFRVVRTNLEFMQGNSDASQVIMMTSANPGSGKTFITFNLAKSFSIKNKRVCIIDLDLRKASLSKYVGKPSQGVSDYLANRVDDISSIIHKVGDAPNLDIIPVGTIPPNPTELLFSDRLKALIADLRLHYDYVFVDCPPVEVVADASIISKFADSTIFIIRAGLLDLGMLPVIDKLYEEGKYPNMSIIINGTLNPKRSRYGNPYTYGYGYTYAGSYHYAEKD